MNILFTVCGRAGSKGLKNKNLKSFLGKPLLYYTLSAIELYCEKYGKKDRIDICVNTDSQALLGLAKNRKPDLFVVKRTPELAADDVGKILVIRDCLLQAEKHYGVEYDMVVDLDITSPLRTVDDVKAAIDKKQEQPLVDVVFSVTNSRRNPYFNMVKKNVDGYYSKVLPSDYTARQQTPEVFDMNASIYAYKPDFVKKNSPNLLTEGVCDVIKMIDTAVLDIDSEEDFLLLEVIAKYFFDDNKGLANIKNNI